MPSAPVYNQQVQGQGIGNTRVNQSAPLEAFGGGDLAAAPTRALQQTGEIFQKEIEKADRLRVMEAETKLQNFKNQLIYDPKSGLMTKKGRDAFGAPDEFNKKFGDVIASIEKDLSSPAQRQAFAARAAEQQSEFQANVNRHVFQESESYKKQVTNGAIEATQNDAVLNYQNPEAIGSALKKQSDVLMQFAQDEGMDADQAKLLVERHRSRTHAAIIDRMIANKEDLRAESYFNSVKGELTDKEDLMSVEAKVQESSLLGKAQRVSEDMMSQGMTLSQAIAEANKLESPREKEFVKQQLRNDYARREQDRNLDQQRVFEAASKTLFTSNGDLKSIAHILPTLDDQERNSLLSRAAQIAKGIEPETDIKTYYGLKEMATNPKLREEFMNTNLMTYSHKLSPSDLKQMIDLQTGMKSGAKGADETLRGYMSDQQIVKTGLNTLGLKQDEEDGIKFQRKVDDQVLQLQKETGKKVTSDQLKNIVDTLAVESVTDNGWIWNTTKRVYELDQGESGFVPFENIPDSAKKTLRDKYKITSKTEVERRYNDALKKRFGN